MEKETNKKVLPKKSILAVVLALLLCGGAYAGLTAYVGDTDEPAISVDVDTEDKKNDEVSADDDRASVDSVVTDSEEVLYERYEIDPVSTEHITIEQPGNEAIHYVKDPNSADSKEITLLTKGVRFVQIVYPEGDSTARIAAQTLNTLLAEKTGYELEVVSDSTGESTYEVLVGATNRSASTETGDYLTKQGAAYAVRSTAKKIALVGTNATALNKAAVYMGETASTKKGEAIFSKNQSYVWNSGNQYQSAILTNEALSAKTKKLYNIDAASGVPQGGCSDGTYFYQMLITKQDTNDENNNECKIVKVNFKTGDVVKVSEALPLNHANDVTYNSKLNCLVVCHNAPNRNTLSYVDVNTLKIKETFKIDYEIYCIDYNASTDRYVVGLSGGQTFRILDGNFKATGKVHMPSDATKDHVTQGVGSDDEFIYFALYMNQTRCVISVFDWDGNHVGILHLDDTTSGSVQGREIETVSVVDGEIYLSCASSTWKYSELYKVTGLQAK